MQSSSNLSGDILVVAAFQGNVNVINRNKVILRNAGDALRIEGNAKKVECTGAPKLAPDCCNLCNKQKGGLLESPKFVKITAFSALF
ncbi:hypothetical protein [Paraburkholderia sp. CNPSo 3281]|uniref:hypothetical protein n=1 Tax=Paraburkholderia sp. CNPSo 3281 TaxID=2940933 RepID=UPI0020B7087F|nr:hypothetical protein [Paraburkholderia sp. CNPSo 3281]MCP3720348.1 hypothetical protein [Paraburkholderia sp. CNPSo 3281]